MTSPAVEINVTCPKCRTKYKDWYRASLNFLLKDYTDEEVKNASSATCPSCGHVVDLDILLVRPGARRKDR